VAREVLADLDGSGRPPFFGFVSSIDIRTSSRGSKFGV
jgi:hypothetical protein